VEIIITAADFEDAIVGAAAAVVRTDAAHAIATRAAGCALVIRLPNDPAGYAHGLFAALHLIDAENAAGKAAGKAVIEAVPADDPAWWAVRDRLNRAAR
jgi:L-threonylcarbamoyladenylate synthase